MTVKICKYEEYEKLLGDKLDCKVIFDDHISDICTKSCRKLDVLVRISPFKRLPKRRILTNTF